MNNVKNAPFNAVGDGVADDSAAIQQALNLGGAVYLPSGTYRIAVPLRPARGTLLIGDGYYNSILSPSNVSVALNLVNDSGGNGSNVTVQDLGISGGGSGVGVLIGGTANQFVGHVKLSRVRVMKMGTGIQVQDAYYVCLRDVHVTANTGIGINIDPPDYSTTITLDNVYADHNGSYGLRAHGANAGVYMDRCVVENNATAQTWAAHNTSNLTIKDSYFEVTSGAAIPAIVLEGSDLDTTSVYALGNKSTRILNCHWEGCSFGLQALARVNQLEVSGGWFLGGGVPVSLAGKTSVGVSVHGLIADSGPVSMSLP